MDARLKLSKMKGSDFMTWFELSGLTTIQSDQKINEDILYLDFGHGGSDSGCTFYDGTKEKDYVLKFGMAVYELVKPFFKKVYLTRSTDKTISLTTRAKNMSDMAKEAKSLQVYSIHCNAYNKVAKGTEWLLSIHTPKSHSDYTFCTQFLKDYCSTFSLENRGIVQKKSKKTLNDYYALHRDTSENCKVKYLELFFGDNRNDCKKGQTQAYFDKATFFVASYILKRYGVQIQKPKPESDVLYLVQTGAFSDKKNADDLSDELKKKGFEVIIKTQKK